MRITVLLFAAARDIAGQGTVELSVDDTLTITNVRRELLQTVPGLAGIAGSLLWAVNHRYVREDHLISPGDTVACFPPVSGG